MTEQLGTKIINTSEAPEAIGPYSQAVKVGNTVYISGQIPLDPATQELVEGGFREQVYRVFDNLKAIIVASDAIFRDIVRLKIYLKDLAHFDMVNEIMKSYFDEPYPARVLIGVADLPREAQIELDAIVVIRKHF